MEEERHKDHGKSDEHEEYDELQKASHDMRLRQQGRENKRLGMLSTKKFTDALIKTLTVYIEAVERMEEEYKQTSVIIARIEKFYDQEKKIFADYQRLLADKKLTTKDLYTRANDIQDSLEAIDYEFSELVRNLRTIEHFFTDKEDRMHYESNINGACLLFNQIYIDIQDLAIEEQALAKKI